MSDKCNLDEILDKIPHGKLTSLSIFFFSAFFGQLAFKSQNVVLEYGFAFISFILIPFGMLVFAGGIICKERVPKGDEK